MKDNILVAVLVCIIIVLGGVSLIFGFGNAVSMAIAPLTTQVTELTAIEKDIQKRQEARGNMDGNTSQLIFLSQRVAALEARLGNNNGAGGNNGQQRPAPSPEDFNKVYPIPVGISPILGNMNAPVTIVEFSDFQCPFCARFHPVLRDVLKAYPTQVRVVIKNFPLPFHPNARPAAKLAMAAGLQGKYYDMVDLLMQNGGSVEDSKIKEYAQTLGINYNQLVGDYKNKDAQWEQIINNDIALGGQVSVQGTPTFFINGRKTQARDLNAYKTEIDKVLSGKA